MWLTIELAKDVDFDARRTRRFFINKMHEPNLKYFAFGEEQKNGKIKWIRNCGKTNGEFNWKLKNHQRWIGVTSECKREASMWVFFVWTILAKRQHQIHAKHDHIDIFIASFDRKTPSTGSGLKKWNSFDSEKTLEKICFRIWNVNGRLEEQSCVC